MIFDLQPGRLQTGKVRRLVDVHQRNYPRLDTSQRVAALSSAFCFHAATQVSDEDVLIAYQLEFVDRVSATLASDG